MPIQSIQTPNGLVKIGSRIRIKKMKVQTCKSRAFPDGIDHQAEALEGTEGTVLHIDSLGQLHGSWGGLAIQPENDSFVIIN